MRILILGSSGYIGRHLVSACQLAEHEVFGVDLVDFKHQITLDKCFTKMNISDTDTLIQYIVSQNIDHIVNVAAKKSVSESFLNSELYFETNAFALERLLNELSGTKVVQFIHASTAAVYGIQSSVVVNEDLTPKPLSPYANSKLMSEKTIANYSKTSEIEFFTLRLFNVLGSKMRSLRDLSTDNLVPSILRMHDKNLPALIFGNSYETLDGTCVRDFIHVSDVCEAILSLINLKNMTINHKILNLGSGEGHSVLEVIEAISSTLAVRVKYEFAPPRIGDIPAIISDNKAIETLINFRAKLNLKEMINSSIYH
jgi:UDP-glucose 4-epimerase